MARFLATVAATAIFGLLGGGCGQSGAVEGDESPPDSSQTEAVSTTTIGSNPALADSAREGRDGAATAHPRRAKRPAERLAAVRQVVGNYATAVNERDGAALCDLFVDGALDRVDLPVRGANCSASLSASIGYADPRGLPVFESVELGRAPAIRFDGRSARVTIPIATSFTDRGNSSFEDDLIYLVNHRDKWRIEAPSIILYRAIGVADLPLSLLRAPR